MTIFGIIFIIVFFVVLIFLFHRDSDELFFSTIASGMLSLVLLFVFSITGFIDLEQKVSPTFGVTHISSMSAKSSINGEFYFGSGVIENVEYYYFMTETNFGYKIIKIKNDDNTYIKEDGNKRPYIEFQRNKTTHLNWFSSIFFEKEFYDEDGKIIIHVPKNSIIKNFKLDLKDL